MSNDDIVNIDEANALQREVFVDDAITFMQSVIAQYGEEKGEAVWDTIVTVLDASVKRQILMRMLSGSYGGKIKITGFVGMPRFVHAIKAVRDVSSPTLGLREAKDLVGMAYSAMKTQLPHECGVVYKGTPVEITIANGTRSVSISTLREAGCLVS